MGQMTTAEQNDVLVAIALSESTANVEHQVSSSQRGPPADQLYSGSVASSLGVNPPETLSSNYYFAGT